jgi:hypothetical protein
MSKSYKVSVEGGPVLVIDAEKPDEAVGEYFARQGPHMTQPYRLVTANKADEHTAHFVLGAFITVVVQELEHIQD